jgi:septum formation protein
MSRLINFKLPIVLASQSPRRKKLLEQIGIDFIVIPSDIDEGEHPLHIEPSHYSMQLAEKKAMDVASKLGYDAIVIGADTIVVIDDEILNKPKSENEAKEMLRRLSGRTHTVFTGVSVVRTDVANPITNYKATEVTFRELTDREIELYVSTGSPMDKAGAYGIQDDIGAVFISHIKGCYYNIVGLPLELLYGMMQQFPE